MVSAPRAHAQDEPQRVNFDELLSSDADKPLYLRYGLFGSWNFATHTANFSQLTTICPTCSPVNFGTASANALGGGILAEFPLAGKLGASLRLSYYTTFAEPNLDKVKNFSYGALSTRFIAPERLLIAPGVSGTPTPASIEHRFNPVLGLLGLEPAVTYRVLDAMTVYLGLHLGYLVQKKFEYLEALIEPDDRVYTESGTVIRNRKSGDLSGINAIIPSLMAGISYEIPLNSTGTWLAAPEAMFIGNALPFPLFGGIVDRSAQVYTSKTSETATVTQDGSWFMNNIRVSLAVKYSPYRTIRPELTPELQEKILILKRNDSLVAEESKRNKAQLARVDSVNKAITAKMEELKKIGISVTMNKIVGVDANGTETPNPKLTIEQFRTQTVQPLLPYIFFDDNSAVLPSRYRRVRAADRNTFKVSDFAGKSNVELYRHVLNIIGSRMSENQASVLFVSGCNSGLGAEKDNLKLSEQRANAISDYLQDVWKIQAKRIVIQKQNLPDKASGNDETGAAENRRVELSSNVPELFEPVKTDKISRLSAPPTLRFGLEINAGAGLKQWDMEINQFVDNESVSLKTFGGTKEYPPAVDWNLNREPNTMPVSGQDLSIQLTMTDINNKTGDAPIVSIPVAQITVERKEVDGKADKRIDTYDIVGFDQTGSALDETGQKVIDVIKKAVKSNSTVLATGYSDAAGDKNAAQRRADLVAKALGGSNVRATAVGPTKENDNALPEGRFYNRYVHVEVQTPTR